MLLVFEAAYNRPSAIHLACTNLRTRPWIPRADWGPPSGGTDCSDGEDSDARRRRRRRREKQHSKDKGLKVKKSSSKERKHKRKHKKEEKERKAKKDKGPVQLSKVQLRTQLCHLC